MAVGTLAALLGSSAVSSAAAMYNNQQNIKYAQEANDVQVGLANTAHQREIRDLEAAGLNPILSASSHGAATPQLKTPSLESIDGNITNSAGSISRAINGMVDAEVKMAQADASSAESDSTIAKAQADVAKRLALNEVALSDSNTSLQLMENAARRCALDGNIPVGEFSLSKDGAFFDLVQQYRNEIENARYHSNVWVNAAKDLLSGASSAADIYGSMKRSKYVGKTRIENVNRVRSGNSEVIRRSSGYMK